MRYTGIALVKAKLLADGHIAAYDAVYTLTDPDGHPHRITRLAAVIHTLRHKHGMVIETRQPPGMLADYVLTERPVATAVANSAGGPEQGVYVDPASLPESFYRRNPDYQGEPVIDATPKPKVYPCPLPECDENLRDVNAILGGYVTGKCIRHGKRTVKA